MAKDLENFEIEEGLQELDEGKEEKETTILFSELESVLEQESAKLEKGNIRRITVDNFNQRKKDWLDDMKEELTFNLVSKGKDELLRRMKSSFAEKFPELAYLLSKGESREPRLLIEAANEIEDSIDKEMEKTKDWEPDLRREAKAKAAQAKEDIKAVVAQLDDAFNEADQKSEKGEGNAQELIDKINYILNQRLEKLQSNGTEAREINIFRNSIKYWQERVSGMKNLDSIRIAFNVKFPELSGLRMEHPPKAAEEPEIIKKPKVEAPPPVEKSAPVKAKIEPKEKVKEKEISNIDRLKSLIEQLNKAHDGQRQDKMDALTKADELFAKFNLTTNYSSAFFNKSKDSDDLLVDDAVEAAVLEAEQKIRNLEGGEQIDLSSFKPSDEVEPEGVEVELKPEPVAKTEETPEPEIEIPAFLTKEPITSKAPEIGRESISIELEEIKNIIFSAIESKAKIKKLEISEIAGGLSLDAELDAGFLAGKIFIKGEIVNGENEIYLKDLDIQAREIVKSKIESKLSEVVPTIKECFAEQKGRSVTSVTSMQIKGQNLVVEFEKESTESSSKINFDVGDEVLWESQGVIQWEKPKKIKSIQEDPKSKRKYVFVEGATTGIPLEELLRPKEVEDQKEIPESEIEISEFLTKESPKAPVKESVEEVSIDEGDMAPKKEGVFSRIFKKKKEQPAADDIDKGSEVVEELSLNKGNNSIVESSELLNDFKLPKKNEIFKKKWGSIVRTAVGSRSEYPDLSFVQSIYLKHKSLQKLPPNSNEWQALRQDIKDEVESTERKYGEIFKKSFKKMLSDEE